MRPDSRDEPDRPDGRRRTGPRVLAWAPGLADPVDRPETTTAPAPPAVEPDTFGGINLVAGPVSVTPPSSWRKAAWFIVAACSIVLIVLIFAAVRLTGPDRRLGYIDAFPGLPTGGLLTTQSPPTGRPAGPSTPKPGAGRQDSSRAPGQPGGGSATGLAPANPDQPEARPSAGDRDGDGDGDGDGGQTSAPPSISMLPTSLRPPVETDRLLEATQQFFAALPEDVDAAWAMMSPRVRVQGYDQFVEHWRMFRAVRLHEMVVDADHSNVSAVVRVTGHNGRQGTQRWQLTYRRGQSLVIDDAVLLDNSGNRPPK